MMMMMPRRGGVIRSIGLSWHCQSGRLNSIHSIGREDEGYIIVIGHKGAAARVASSSYCAITCTGCPRRHPPNVIPLMPQSQDIPTMGIPLNGFIVCQLAIDGHGSCPNAIFDSKGWWICDKLGQLMHPTDSLRGDFGIPVEFHKLGEEEGLKRGHTGWLM